MYMLGLCSKSMQSRFDMTIFLQCSESMFGIRKRHLEGGRFNFMTKRKAKSSRGAHSSRFKYSYQTTKRADRDMNQVRLRHVYAYTRV